MPLSAQAQQVVRETIAQILKIDVRQVVPNAKLMIDFNASMDQLKAIRLGIESALKLRIEPIVDEVNERTAIDEYFVLTKASQQQILEYLGPWPKAPKQRVSFFVLFTVGMMEAMVAKALSLPELAQDTAAPIDVPAETPMLPANLKQVLYQEFAESFGIPSDEVTPSLDLLSLGEDADFALALSLQGSTAALGVDVLKELN